MTTTRAEIIIHGGTIRTMDMHQPFAEAVAVAGGRVTAVGLLEAVEATSHPNTHWIDLAGRTLIPGFHDAHTRLCEGGLQLIGLAGNTEDPKQLEDAILKAAKEYLRFGVTSVTEVGARPAQIAAYRKLAVERHLPLRTNLVARRYGLDGMKIPLPERAESNWLRIDTVWLDSTDQAKELRYSEDQLRALIWDIHRAGLRAVIDANSKAAISQTIDAIEYASHRLISRLKHRIDGFAEGTPDQIAHCQHQIGITLTSSVAPLLSVLSKAELVVGVGTDSTALAEIDPLRTIRRFEESQAITASTLLPLYTLGSAAVAGEENLKGSILPGKYADFAVLSGDPVRAPTDRLTDLRVELTMVNGIVVYGN